MEVNNIEKIKKLYKFLCENVPSSKLVELENEYCSIGDLCNMAMIADDFCNLIEQVNITKETTKKLKEEFLDKTRKEM